MRTVLVMVMLALGLVSSRAAAVLKPALDGERVRVLISAQFGNLGFSDLYLFPEVALEVAGTNVILRRAESDRSGYALAVLPGRPLRFTLRDGQIRLEYAGTGTDLGSRVALEALEARDDDRVRYRLLSTRRGQVSPEYPGRLELSVRDGRIAVVNDLSMESYLMRVVPSEMPDSFHPEALEAQAIAARTYALSRVLAPPEGNRWKAFGADVDDSVAEQVYNNIPTSATTDAAVNATRGQVLLYHNEPITTNYASTTAGWSANIDEVWPDRERVPYLISQPQSQPALKAPEDEAGWLAFFKSRDATGFFDGGSSLWRWKVAMTGKELEAILSRALPERLKAYPQFTTTLEGTAPDAPNFGIGSLQALKLVRRAAGGYVVALEIVGSNGRWQVMRESQIRSLLRPTKAYSGMDADIVLERGNRRTTANFSSLPSASFSWEEERDASGNLVRITFYGGGFGHGVGMSQFGADGMGKLGFASDQILAHFYPGTELKTLYP